MNVLIKITARTMTFRKPKHFLNATSLAVALLLSGCAEKKNAESVSSIVDRNINEANNFIQQGNLEGAIDLLERCNKEHPDQANLLENLAFAYLSLPDTMLAAFYFEQVFRLDETRTELLPYAAKAYASEAQWDAAAKAYTTYLHAIPSDLVSAYALADIYQASSQPKPAIETILIAIQANNRKANAQESARLGLLYQQLGNTSHAKAYYNVALASQDAKARADALIGLMDIAIQANDYDEAKSFIRALQKEAPDLLRENKSYNAYVNWQSALDKQHREAEERRRMAENERKRIEAEDRMRRESESELRRVEEAEKEYKRIQKENERRRIEEERKRTEYEQYLADNPPPPPPLHSYPYNELVQMASDARRSGNLAEAIRISWAAVNKQPNNSPGWYELAHAYMLNEEYQQAESCAQEAIRQEPENVAHRLLLLDIVQRGSKSPDRLMEELHRAYEDLPDSPEIILALARGYDVLENNKRNAHCLYSEFLEKAPLTHPERPGVEAAIHNLHQ